MNGGITCKRTLGLIDAVLRRWREDHGVTEAQGEVVREAAMGFRLREIAKRRGVAASTIKAQVNELAEKLGVSGRSALPRAAVRLLREALAERATLDA